VETVEDKQTVAKIPQALFAPGTLAAVIEQEQLDAAAKAERRKLTAAKALATKSANQAAANEGDIVKAVTAGGSKKVDADEIKSPAAPAAASSKPVTASAKIITPIKPKAK
jgi:hypothetical protein